jgi:hypothetical protein
MLPIRRAGAYSFSGKKFLIVTYMARPMMKNQKINVAISPNHTELKIKLKKDSGA